MFHDKRIIIAFYATGYNEAVCWLHLLPIGYDADSNLGSETAYDPITSSDSPGNPCTGRAIDTRKATAISARHRAAITITALRGCNQKFPDWPPGTKTANGTALYH